MAGYTRDRHGNRVRCEIPAHSAGICHSDGCYSRGSITSRRTHLMPAMGFLDKLRLIGEWSPILSILQQYAGEPDTHKKVLVVMDALEFLASKTQTKLDDGLVTRLDAVLRTPQGEDLVRYVVEQISEATK